MTVTICTGAWGPKAKNYIENFLPGLPNLPADVRVLIYTDAMPAGRLIRGGADTNWHFRPLDDLRGWREFLARNAADEAKWGRKPNEPRAWKPGTVAKGYNFRFDANRFAGQGFVPEAAMADMAGDDILVWLDADSVARQPIPKGWFEGLLDGSDGAYLGRGAKHSEIGFWAIRVNPLGRTFCKAFAAAYRTDMVFDLAEWHSAFVWDHIRRHLAISVLRMRDLTPGGSGHVWQASPLQRYMIHNKGERKAFDAIRKG